MMLESGPGNSLPLKVALASAFPEELEKLLRLSGHLHFSRRNGAGGKVWVSLPTKGAAKMPEGRVRKL